MVVTEWDPARYAAFRGLRLRPALDLLAQVGEAPAGDVIDLGCGDGAVAGALRARFPAARLVGVDGSAAMLAKAVGYGALVAGDIAAWQPETPPALIFSNAALQWLPAHEALLPRLAGFLVPGGVLAVQMPRQWAAPSHRLIGEVAAALFPGRFAAVRPDPVAAPEDYHALLAGIGETSLWETEYLQILDPVAEGHPVRAFTQSTAARRVLDGLAPDEAERFLAAYDAALAGPYPAMPDGRVRFPFRRVFLVLRKVD